VVLSQSFEKKEEVEVENFGILMVAEVELH
jgi:hypothetical protein